MRNIFSFILAICVAHNSYAALSLKDESPGPVVDSEGDTIIQPASGGALELADDTGTTQLSISALTTNVNNNLQEDGVDVATTADLTAKADLVDAIFSGSILFGGDGPTNIVVKSEDNALSKAGIAFQNSGASFTGLIHRETQVSPGADIVFRAGLGSDALALPEVMRIRNHLGPADTQNDVVFFNDAHAVGMHATSFTQNGNDVLDESDDTLMPRVSNGIDLNLTNGDIFIDGSVANANKIRFSNSNGTVDKRVFDLGIVSGNTFSIIMRDDSGLGIGSLGLTHDGRLTTDSFSLFDEAGRRYTIEKNPDGYGIQVQPSANPPAGASSFSVRAALNALLFNVPHNAPITTTNSDMYFDTQDDGTGGYRAIHEGNIHRTSDIVFYPTGSTAPTNAEKAQWCGKTVVFMYNPGTVTLPVISADDTPTASQFEQNCWFLVRNGNDSAIMSFSLPGTSHSWVITDLGDVRTSGNTTIDPGDSRMFTALDLTTEPLVGERAFYLWQP